MHGMQRQHVCSAVAMSCAVSQMKCALLTAPRNSVPQATCSHCRPMQIRLKFHSNGASNGMSDR